MKVDEYFVNNRSVFFIEIDSLSAFENCYSYSFYTSVDSCNDIFHNILSFLIQEKREFDYIVFQRTVVLMHCFDSGIRNEIKMIVGKHYRTNAADVQIDEIFEYEFRPILMDKGMSDRFASIFLKSLRKSFIVPNSNTDAMLEHFGVHGLQHDMHRIDELRQRIQSLNGHQISLILKTILNNEITYSTSSNVFNLHKNEPAQQNALNIKHVKNNVGTHDSSLNDTYHVIALEELAVQNLKSNNTYIIENNDCVFIEMQINYFKFSELLGRDIFYCFKILELNLALAVVQAAIPRDYYAYFRTQQINRKLIQFRIMKPTEYADSIGQICCYQKMRHGVWQSGNAKLLNLVSFSEETFSTTLRTFQLYGIFCIDFLKHLSKETKCCLEIRRCIEYREFNFLYALCTVNTIYAKYVLTTLIPQYIDKKCVVLTDYCPIDAAIWSQRTCCVLLYHTHFKWVCEALNEKHDCDDDIIIENAIQNLINYKYITGTKNLNITLDTPSDAETYAQILIETRRNVSRDLKQYIELNQVHENPTAGKRSRQYRGRVKFSHFDGVKDGPLVAATSIRTCEKITNTSVFDREWGINVLNVSMLLNIPDYRGVQNQKNALYF